VRAVTLLSPFSIYVKMVFISLNLSKLGLNSRIRPIYYSDFSDTPSVGAPCT